MFTELREGWAIFAGTTWLWVVVLAFSMLNVIHSGAWNGLQRVLVVAGIGYAAIAMLTLASRDVRTLTRRGPAS